YDWKEIDGTGIDAESFLLTGYLPSGDYQRGKQTVYMTTHFKRTDTMFLFGGGMNDGFVGSAAQGQYISSGGVPEVTYSNTGGSLPTGVNVTPEGDVQGEFSEEGHFVWQMSAVDAEGNKVSLENACDVYPRPYISGNMGEVWVGQHVDFQYTFENFRG